MTTHPEPTATPLGAALAREFKPSTPVSLAISPADAETAREKATLDLIRAQRREDGRLRWEASCPYLLKTTDWDNPTLKPYAAAQQRILGYQMGLKGILATGQTGRGKSRAMWQLMRRLAVEEGIDSRYWSANDWFAALQENIRYGRDEARGWVEAVARRPVVFLDDLGQEAVQDAKKDWAEAWFFQFLDMRVGHGLPLFITTNLTSREIAGQTTGVRANPLVRRLLDVCEPVNFD